MLPRILFFLVTVYSAFAFTVTDDCKIMHEGRFSYMADDEEIMVVIDDTSLVEYHKRGTIKTKLEWLTPCEYNITVLRVNVPSFPMGPGDEMNVKIRRVEGREIFYTATVKAVSWDGKFTKLEEGDTKPGN